MLKKMFFTLFVLMALSVFTSARAEDAPACVQLDEKASGDMAKYSLYGDAKGPVFFSGINCAIEHRNKVLCAMEMISFDATAKVYDYNTEDEIDVGKAYFWIDEKNKDERIRAFGSKEAAEKFGAAKEGGVVVDYSGLTEKLQN